MNEDKFFQVGKIIYLMRWVIVIITLLIVILCLPLVPKAISQFTTIGFNDPASQSAHADTFLKKNLEYHRNQFIVVYQSKKDKNPNFKEVIKNSLQGLKNFPIKHEIIYPDKNNNQISKNKTTAYAVIALKSNELLSTEMIDKFKSLVKTPADYKVLFDGEPIFISETSQQTEKDLIRAEYIATPIAIITLLIVFGSITAALIPLILDGICTVFILSILALIGGGFSLSVFTINIALLLGICLTLDYALFIINRFRNELEAGHPPEIAIALTHATAGKAVFFSALAVFASLSALLLFPINILFSVGVGGITAVAVAMIVSIIVLPAFLSILKNKINFLPIRNLKKTSQTNNLWVWLVGKVVKYPWSCFIGILVLLLFLGSPFLSVTIGISDFKILPKTLQSRQVFDIFKSEFNENQLTPIVILVKSKNNILTTNNIGNLYDFVQKLKKITNVERVDSIVSADKNIKKNQYEMLYTKGKSHRSASLSQLLKLTTEKKFTVITVISKYPHDARETKELVKKIRNLNISKNLSFQVAGETANTMDVLHKIALIFPYAFLWVIFLSYIILLILLRSLFLPIKAILTNMLSLFASYGLLVFIIQKGYFASILNFEPQGKIDITLLIIIFCALFGFSMDYEVFLLSRIKEYYEQTRNNVLSICYGITHSSKIITSAAIIVILICFSFISADIIMVKAFGLGIAIAIFVDAFLIRTVLVPAAMTLLGKWNWYLPRWLDRILPSVFFSQKKNIDISKKRF